MSTVLVIDPPVSKRRGRSRCESGALCLVSWADIPLHANASPSSGGPFPSDLFLALGFFRSVSSVCEKVLSTNRKKSVESAHST